MSERKRKDIREEKERERERERERIHMCSSWFQCAQGKGKEGGRETERRSDTLAIQTQ